MRVECTAHGVLLDSDDGFDVEQARMAHDKKHIYRRGDTPTRIIGVHSSHTGGSQCGKCGRPLNNGCYGSHFPCGFDFGGNSLVSVVAEHFASVSDPQRRNGE